MGEGLGIKSRVDGTGWGRTMICKHRAASAGNLSMQRYGTLVLVHGTKIKTGRKREACTRHTFHSILCVSGVHLVNFSSLYWFDDVQVIRRACGRA